MLLVNVVIISLVCFFFVVYLSLVALSKHCHFLNTGCKLSCMDNKLQLLEMALKIPNAKLQNGREMFKDTNWQI